MCLPEFTCNPGVWVCMRVFFGVCVCVCVFTYVVCVGVTLYVCVSRIA